jgi:hypothetical protein
MSPSIETHSNSAGQNGMHRKFLSEVRRDLVSQAGRIIPDLQTISELGQTAFNGGLVDDRKYLVCSDLFALKCKTHIDQIENIIQGTVSLPNTSALRDKITDTFISTLWDNLQHPPLSYLGDQFKYRTADGSYNVCFPILLAG